MLSLMGIMRNIKLGDIDFTELLTNLFLKNWWRGGKVERWKG